MKIGIKIVWDNLKNCKFLFYRFAYFVTISVGCFRFFRKCFQFFLSEASSLIIVMYTYITFLQFKNNWDLRLWGKFENVLAIDRMFVSLQHSCLDSGSPIAVGNFFSCHLSSVHIGIIVILLFPQAQWLLIFLSWMSFMLVSLVTGSWFLESCLVQVEQHCVRVMGIANCTWLWHGKRLLRGN